MQRKSQSALEFLTTYGWAFLVIIIMIGTLAYFGILSPSKLLPNRCNFGSEFQCLDHQIASNSFKMRIKNSVGEAIIISSVTYSTETASFTCATVVPTDLLTAAWNSGTVKDITYSGAGCAPPGLVVGEKGKILVVVRWYPVSSGNSYQKETRGEVFSTVI